MQLRKIELLGFKSFAERTEFAFDAGITGVVGPNGCGKSNLVDAVRWVLGEQSAKSLRASAMNDCIFAGAAGLKPMGMAEVTLSFDNSSGKLALPYQDVEITRRVYGSGEGEYFINRQPCRLRDIRELFMGTGVGTTAYSVIEQGEITRIISSDPRELRAVFDEAAGIGLYKTRLRAAQAKLERVSQNLLRVNDVLGEVEKSLRSVKYQAAKAHRFRELSARVRDLRMNRARRAYRDLGEKLGLLRAALDDKRSSASSLESALADLESRSDAASRHLESLEHEIQSLSADVQRLDAREADLKHSSELCRQRIAHHEENEARLSAAVDQRRSDLEAFEIRAVELESRTLRVQARTDRLSRAAAAAAEIERAAADSERQLDSALSSSDARAVELLRAGAKLNNRLSEIEANERSSAQQKEKLASRLAELSSQSLSLESELAALAAESSDLAARSASLRQQISSLREARAACESTRSQVEKDLKAANEHLAAVSSRRELLEDLQKRREGISTAARAVLDMQLPGVRGLVAELLSIPRDMAAAVESLLSDDAGAVIVDTTATALEAAARLSQLQSGRAKIISLERASRQASRLSSATHGLKPVAPSISPEPGCEALVHALFGNALLAPTIDSALASFPDGIPAGFTVVTPAGEKLTPDGGLTAGRAGQAGGLIWRKAEIESLSLLEAQIRGEAGGLDARKLEIESGLAVLLGKLSALEHSLSEVSTQALQVEGRIAAAGERRASLDRELSVVRGEVSAIEEDLAKAAVERDAVKARIEDLRRDSATLEREILSLKERRSQAVDRREHARSHSTTLKVALAQSLEKQSSLERQLSDARAALEEKARALEDSLREIDLARDSAARERRSLDSAFAGMHAAHRDANSARIVLSARSREDRALRDELARLSPALKDTRLSLDAARQVLSELSVDERGVSVQLGEIINRAREEFDAGIDALSAAPIGMDDPSAADAEIEDLSRKLASMGAVNMEALAELDQLQTRRDFLAGQRDDLAAARDSLEGIINRTRATSRKMFLESFESVRENFSSMFRRLFGGGRAECILLNPEDVLESPIQITAKPPGKEPSNLNLLSGGEKAMTAVALLFAMFATRPSPFLILDEVDAPLDESNIGRFIDLMGDFLPQCQFVVITHNRRTMAAADTLYGITMEEQGVSKKVSVSFNSQAATPEPVTV